MRGFSFLFLFVLLLIGCNRSIKSIDELKEYVQSNKSEFVKKKQFKQMEVTVKCLPSELLKNSDADNIGGEGLTFIFSIEGKEKDFLKRFSNSFEEYRQLKWYLTNEWSDFIYLEQNGIRIEPDLAQFEERYELGKGCVFNIVFDTSKLDKNEKGTFVFNDQIFGMGKLKFKYDLPFIMNMPIIKIL